MPQRSKSLLTTSNFSIRCWCSSAWTSSAAAPSPIVTRFSRVVIIVETGFSKFVSKRMSRRVTIPTRSLPLSTGTPEIPFLRVSSSNSPMLASSWIVIGSLTTPLSYFLTLRTWAACSSTVMLLWTMPIPPSWATAMARAASVTVSIAAERRGMLSSISRVSNVFRETSVATTSEYPGTSRTSSKVRASWAILSMDEIFRCLVKRAIINPQPSRRKRCSHQISRIPLPGLSPSAS